MSDYSNTWGGAAKDAADATANAADLDVEFDGIATASATKANKTGAPATTNNLAMLDASGDLADSLIETDGSGNFSGSIVGDVTGDVTGDLTGDVTGFVNTLKQKVVEIGDWNMNWSASGTNTISVAHGLTVSDIRRITVMIRDDTVNRHYTMDMTESSSSVYIRADTTNVTITRSSVTSDLFDNSVFDTTSYNRGWIIIDYIA